MNQIAKEKTMTVKEISETLGYDESTIRKIGKELYPDYFRNGLKTYLNELQITNIKLHLGKNSELPKTKLERLLLIKQADQFRDEMIVELQKENEILKPKALVYDSFLSGKNWISGNESAKVLNIGRNRMYHILRDKHIWMDNNTPYQSYMNSGYFKVIEKPIVMNGKTINKPQTFFSPKGIKYLKKLGV